MAEKKILNQNTNWNKILDLIKDNKFSCTFPDYTIQKKEKGYLIQKKDNKENIFLLTKERSIKIYFDKTIYETKQILSSLEIENFIKERQKNIDDLYVRKKEDIKYIDILKELGCYIKDCEFELREKKTLDELKLKEILSDEEDYKPSQYSKYFYEYFIYEDKTRENKIIIYQNNRIRKIINDNIKELKWNKDLKTFKFTGPHSIGKSFTLFRISRIYYNIAYINLKILDENKNNLYKSYSIIMHELERANINNNELYKLNKLIKESYDTNKSHLKLLLNIIQFLNGLNQIFIFILDQFKMKYVENGFLEKIKEFGNIKIVYCSSINDKWIRDECIKTWTKKGKNLFELKKDNQDYYFYFKIIYNFFLNNNESTNDILRQFAYMPKYIKKYNDFNDTNKFYDDTRTRIEKKIDEFCSSNKIEKSLLLTNLKYIINKEFNIEKFESVIPFCPLKYFIVDFRLKGSYFVIRPIFPFMINIVNYKFKETECLNYFKNKIYKKDTIVNDYVKGDYFEMK